MISEARSLAQTFGPIKTIKRKFSNYVVGSCLAKWHTGDSDVDAIYAKNWANSMARIDAGGKRHFRLLAKIAVARQVIDGDIFAQKTKSADGYAQVRLIEADRVNNGMLYAPDTDDMVGGVKLGPNKTPIGIRVTERDRFGQFRNPTDLPISSVVHYYDPMRVDGVRGVTELDTALNSIRDLKEIIDAERSAVKLNGKIALIMKSVTGGASGRNAWASSATTGSDSTGSGNDVYVEDINDAMTRYMFPNEDVKAHQPSRPGGDWLQFAQFLIQMIATGVDLPYGLVWSMIGTGPAVRHEIKAAERTFRAKTDLLEDMFIKPIVAYVTSVDIDAGRIPFHENWSNFSIPKPASISIDAGRDSKSGLDEIAQGVGTATAWCEDEGLDFEQMVWTKGREAALYREVADQYGVSIDEIRIIPGRQAANATQTTDSEETSDMETETEDSADNATDPEGED